MSEYSFGDMSYSGGDPDDGQGSGRGAGQDQGPKWFRDYMDKANQQIKTLTDALESERAEKQAVKIASAFQEKGYAPSAAALYTGTPDQLDAWLETHGSALARSDQQPPAAPPVPGEMQQQPTGGLPPAVQADLHRMQQMGQASSLAGGQSSDDQLAAALAATSSPEEFLQVAQAHGWQYNANNMGFQ